MEMDFTECVIMNITNTNSYASSEAGIHILLELNDIARLSYTQGVMDGMRHDNGVVAHDDVENLTTLFVEKLDAGSDDW